MSDLCVLLQLYSYLFNTLFTSYIDLLWTFHHHHDHNHEILPSIKLATGSSDHRQLDVYRRDVPQDLQCVNYLLSSLQPQQTFFFPHRHHPQLLRQQPRGSPCWPAEKGNSASWKWRFVLPSGGRSSCQGPGYYAQLQMSSRFCLSAKTRPSADSEEGLAQC